MKSFMAILNEKNRLEKVNKNAVDTNTEVAIQHIVDALDWILEVESTTPFDALGLEEGIQS